MRREFPNEEPAAMEAAARERSETVARLVAARGVDTLLVSIPRVARLLGYAPSTLYGYIKAGTFFLPYRSVHGSPTVAVDDLVAWLSSREAEIAPRKGMPVGPRPLAPSDSWRAKAERKALAAAAKARGAGPPAA